MAQEDIADAAHPDASRFSGKTFTIAGKLPASQHQQIVHFVRIGGGQLVEDIRPSLNYLVILGRGTKLGDRARQKAETLNQQGASIQILDYQEASNLFRVDAGWALALLRSGTAGAERLAWLRQVDKAPIDLSGADLRGVRLLREQPLHWMLYHVKLDGADLSGATLEGQYLDACVETRFDGARMATCLLRERLVRCSLRHANLRQVNANGVFVGGCDFTGADLEQAEAYGLHGPGVIFREARLSHANLYSARLSGADFTRADLSRGAFMEADFSQADFRGANLHKADLTRVNLKGSDLRQANLTGSVLLDADLTDVKIDDADFTGANLTDARMTGLDRTRAKGLTPPQTVRTGPAGPNIQRLVELAKQAEEFLIQARVELPDGNHVDLIAAIHEKGRTCWARCQESGPRPPTVPYRSRATTLDGMMLDLPRRWLGARLVVDSAKLQIKGPQLGPKENTQLACAAWCEAFGMPVP